MRDLQYRNRTRDMVLCGIFAALIAVGAFIRIPTPVVSITLQTLFVMLAGLLLGGRLAAVSASIYMCLGLIGIPIFTEGGGISYIFKPSFGYIVGFIAGAYIIGRIAAKSQMPDLKRMITANFVGIGVIYLLGISYCYFITTVYLGKSLGLWELFMYCFLLVIPGDILACFVSAWLAKKLLPVISDGRTGKR